MVLESSHQNGPWSRGGIATVRGLDTGDRPYTGPGRQFGGTHFADPWLFSRGEYIGFNALMADGSVQRMRADLNPTVLETLLTIAGGEKVPPDW
jgi:prepilin-type processing-associated H-X9-DG protein